MKVLFNLFLFILCCGTGLAQNNYPVIWNTLMKITQWESVYKTEKYELYQYQLKEYPIPAFKIEMLLEADPQSVLDLAWDVSSYPSALPSSFTTSADIDSRIDSIQIAWQIIDIPLLAPRLYWFRHIRTSCSVDWYKISIDNNFKNDNIIPLFNVGSWKVSEINGKNILTYTVLTDPNGNIPGWIVKKAQMNYLPKMLLEAEKYALSLNN